MRIAVSARLIQELAKLIPSHLRLRLSAVLRASALVIQELAKLIPSPLWDRVNAVCGALLLSNMRPPSS